MTDTQKEEFKSKWSIYLYLCLEKEKIKIMVKLKDNYIKRKW